MLLFNTWWWWSVLYSESSLSHPEPNEMRRRQRRAAFERDVEKSASSVYSLLRSVTDLLLLKRKVKICAYLADCMCFLSAVYMPSIVNLFCTLGMQSVSEVHSWDHRRITRKKLRMKFGRLLSAVNNHRVHSSNAGRVEVPASWQHEDGNTYCQGGAVILGVSECIHKARGSYSMTIAANNSWRIYFQFIVMFRVLPSLLFLLLYPHT